MTSLGGHCSLLLFSNKQHSCFRDFGAVVSSQNTVDTFLCTGEVDNLLHASSVGIPINKLIVPAANTFALDLLLRYCFSSSLDLQQILQSGF